MTQPTTFTCQKCGYQWTPRPGRLEQARDKPLKCANPRCQNLDWDKKGD